MIAIAVFVEVKERRRDINLRDYSKIWIKWSKIIMKNPCQDNRPVDWELLYNLIK